MALLSGLSILPASVHELIPENHLNFYVVVG